MPGKRQQKVISFVFTFNIINIEIYDVLYIRMVSFCIKSNSPKFEYFRKNAQGFIPTVGRRYVNYQSEGHGIINEGVTSFRKNK